MANPQREQKESSIQSTPQRTTGEQAGAQVASTQPSAKQQERTQEGGSGLSWPLPTGLASAFTSPFSLTPFGFMRRMIEDMDRMFEDVLGRAWSGGQEAQGVPLAVWVPQVELVQQGDELIVRADLPGTQEEDLRVEVLDNALVIAGERRSDREEERGNVFRSERMYGSFRRMIPLPEGADAQNASASFANGVLEIRVNLPGQRQQRRQLEIKRGSQRDEDAGAGKRVH